ncbi:FlgD immunoglobulin-like domain containing protein [Oceanispirochaeta crateris]|uniref:FlgD immunoglobulin-like domain containing protein n=1 Tax=Oceanispirochaeta crateris TaxID=2518645 RepID=UPI001AF0065A|nr:FlgD immunoglobulin-like domain containing protein [Oceanispirochaeta crateris]
MIALLVPTWGQNQTQYPSESGNYSAVVGSLAQGALDRVEVVFFEIPSEITSDLYFAVKGATQRNADPDESNAGTTTFYLIGGVGAHSSASSQSVSYADTSYLTGTPLRAFQVVNRTVQTGTAPDTSLTLQAPLDTTGTAYATTADALPNDNTTWIYFPAVNATQGELIGSKRYFKVVVHHSTSGSNQKNAFQLDVSLVAPASSPTLVPDARSFSYSRVIGAYNATAGGTWNIHPLVPAGSTGTVDFYNFDMDSTESIFWENIDDSRSGTLTVGTVSGGTEVDNISILDSTATGEGIDTKGTWLYQIVEISGAGTDPNPFEVWVENDGEPLRLYSSEINTVPDPYYVAISTTSTTATTGTSVQINLQIVDSTGSPVDYRQNIYVEAQDVDGTSLPVISPDSTGTADTEVITTSAAGAASFTLSESDDGDIVTIALFTDGTNGSDDFGAGTDDSVSITFADNPLPVIESLGDTSVLEGTATAALQRVVISDDGVVDLVSGNTLSLKLDTTETVIFKTTSPTVTVWDSAGGAGTGVIGATSRNVDTKVFDFPITTTFASGDYVTIEGLEIDASGASVTSDQSFSLQLDYDGDASYDATDTRTITITDSTTRTYIGSDGVWTTDSNWSPATAPVDGDSVIVSPTATTGTPLILDASVTSLANLTIQGGAYLDLNGNDLTVASIFSNNGTLRLTGTETTTITNDTDSGTVQYTAGPIASLPLGDTYYHLTFGDGSAVSYLMSGNLTVNGDMVINDNFSVVDSGSFNLVVTGNLMLSGGSSVLSYFAGGTIGVSGNVVNNGTIQNKTGLITFQGAYSGTGTMDFAGTGDIVFQGNVDFSGGAIDNLDSSDLFVFSGGAAQQLTTGGVTMPPLQLNSAGGTVSLADDATLTALADLTLTAGTLDLDGNTITIPGNLTFAAAGILIDSAGVIDLSGNWDNTLAGTYTASGTALFSGTTALTSGGESFNDMTVSGALTLNDGTDVNGDLGIAAAGTLTDGGFQLNTAGDFTVTSGGTLTLTGTTVFDGTTSLTSAAENFNDVTVTGALTLTDDAALNSSGDLTLSSGTLDLDGNTITIPGNLTFAAAGTLIDTAGIIDLSGDWDNTAGGTYTATGTVRFLDNATSSVISGDTGFFNFQVPNTVGAKTLQFTALSTQSVSGAFNVQGTDAANRVILESTSAGTLWLLDLSSATVTADYLEIQDSDLVGAAPAPLSPVTSGSFVDNGNNDIFAAGTGSFGDDNARWDLLYTWTGTIDNDWDTPGNWSPTTVPGAGTTVVIPNVANDPVKAASSGAVSLDSLEIQAGASLSMEGNSLTVTSTYTNAGTGVLQLRGDEAVVSLPASPIPGIVEYYGSGGTQTGLSGGNSYTNLAFIDNTPGTLGSDTLFELGAGLTVSGILEIDTGYELDLTGFALDVTGLSSFTNAGVLRAAGTETITNLAGLQTGAGSAIPGSVEYDGTGSAVLGNAYIDLQINGTGDITLGANLDVSGTLTVTSGALSIANRTLTVATLDHQAGGSLSGTTGAVSVTDATLGSDITMSGAGTISFSGGAVDLTGDTVLSSVGGDITLDSTFDGANDLTANAGAGDVIISEAIGGGTRVSAVSLTGAEIRLGSGISTDNSALTFSSPVLLMADTLLDTNTGAGNITFSSTLNTNASPFTLGLTAGTGDITFDGVVGIADGNANRPGTLTISSAVTINQNADVFLAQDLAVTAGDWQLGAVTLDLDGSLSGAGSLTSTAASAINIGTNLTVTTFTHGGSSIVTFDEAPASSVGTYSFFNLVINKTGAANTVLSTGAWTVTGSLTMTQGTWTAGAFTHQIAGSWDSSSANFSWVEAGSTIQLTSTNPGIITSGGAADPFNNLTLDDGGVLSTSAVNVDGTLLLSSGSLSTVDQDLTVATLNHQGAGTISGTTGAITVTDATLGSDITMSGAGTTSFSGGAVDLTGDTVLSSVGGDITLDSTFDGANNLSVNTGTGDVIISAAIGGGTRVSAVSLTGAEIRLGSGISTDDSALTFSSPVLLMADTLLDTNTGAGNITFSSTLNTNASPFTLGLTAGTGDITFDDVVGIADGNANRPGTLTVTSAVTINQNADVFLAQDLAVTAGDWQLGAVTLDLDGSLSGAGSLTSTAASAINIGTNLTVTTFTHGGSSTVTFDESPASSVGTYSFFNLVINKTGAANTVLSTGAWTVTGSLTMTQGTWTAGAFTHQIAGSWDSSSANFSWVEAGSTIQLTSTNPGIITSGGAADPFNNLTLDDGGVLSTSAVNVDGTLLLSSGSLDTVDQDLTVVTLDHQGAGTISGTTGTIAVTNATLGNNITKSSGALNVSGGTLVSLTGPVALDAGLGTISLGTDFSGAFALTLTAATSTITSDLGTTVDLASFTANGTVNITTTLETSGDMLFNDDVVLTGGDSSLTSSAGNITFTGTVEDDVAAAVRALTLDSGGTIIFSNTVGSLRPLGILTVDGATTGVTASNTIDAYSMVITNGGAVDLNGTITVPNGFSSTGTTFDNTGASITTTDTDIVIDHTGDLTLHAALSTGVGGVGIIDIDTDGTISLNAPITSGDGNVTIDSVGLATLTAFADITTTSGTVEFGGTSTGSLNTAADVTTVDAAITFNQAVTLSGGGTVTIDSDAGAGDITFNGNIDGTSSENLIVDAGIGNVAFNSAPIGSTTAIGDLTVTGTSLDLFTIGGGSAGAGTVLLTADSAGSITLRGTDYFTSGPQTYVSGSGGIQYLRGAGSGAMNAGANTITFGNAVDSAGIGDLYLNFSGFTLTLQSDVVCGQFVFLNGTLNLNEKTLSTSNNGGRDLVLLNGTAATIFDDPDWSAANTRFEYIDRSSLLFDPGTYSAAFSDLEASTINVEGNFYSNGVDLPATASWYLNVQNNNTSTPVHNPGNTATDWGTPYNVFFNGTVENSVLNGGGTTGSVAAAASVGANDTGMNATDGGGNTVFIPVTGATGEDAGGWQFSRPSITSIETVWDNTLRITFDQRIENSNNEIQNALDNVTEKMTSNNGNYDIALAYRDFELTTGTPSTLTSTIAQDLDVIYVVTSAPATETWNTDADGVSAGASGDSTDSYGVTQTALPDLTLFKSMLYSAGGKTPIRDYGGANNTGTSRFTATTDECPPLLVAVKAGVTAHGSDSSLYLHNDAHNYLTFRYSEPVDFFNNASDSSTVTIPQSNTRANAIDLDGGGTNFLGHIDNSLTTVQVNEIMTFPGEFYSGSFDGTSQVNSFEQRSSAFDYELQINIAGYSTPAAPGASSRDWPGYLGASGYTLTNPHDVTFTGVVSNFVKDALGNSSAINSRKINTDALTGVPGWAAADMPSGWDVDAPTVAPYRVSGIFEIIPLDETADTVLDRFEFHILDDGSTSGSWDSETSHSDSSKGIRDSSLRNGTSAFLYESAGVTPMLNTYNNSTLSTTVTNDTFGPTGSVTDVDDPYFSVLLNPGAPWDTLTKIWVEYQEDVGYLTDLAGNRLLSFDEKRAVEYIPPEISLTLAVPGNDWIYVKFSEPVYGNTAASAAIDAGDIYYSGGSLTITAIEDYPGGTSNEEFIFRLSDSLVRDDIFTGRIVVKPLSIYDLEGNSYQDKFVRRISDLGIDVVEPIWASDGIHDESIQDGTSLKVFDGSGRLMDRDILIQARINASTVSNSSMRLYYDANVPDSSVVDKLWLPSYHPDLSPEGNFSARYLNASEVVGNGLQNFIISSSDEEMEDGNTIEFLFFIDNLPCVRLTNSSDIWSFEPWKIRIDDIREQRGGVTILNNVINPNNGDKAVLMYEVSNPGVVTAQIFTLNGNLVRILQRGRQAAGSYQYVWDGKNNGGNIVARGVYFVRVVGPDMDEIRKVMVVK